MHTTSPTRLARGLIVLATCAAAGFGATDALAAEPPSLRPVPGLEQATAEVVRAGVPGVLVAVRDGHRTRVLGRGTADRRRHVPMGPGLRFRVGSVTKPFTAAVVLQLVGEGRLRLADTVEQWLPGLVANGDRVTIEDLLQMRSGIGDFEADVTPLVLADPARTWTPAQMIAIGTDKGPQFEPGTRFDYSNTNYLLLGEIVAKATGTSIGAQLRQRLFRPLGLRHTSYDLQGTIRGSHFHGYLDVDGKLVDTHRWNPSWGGAAGAITSTTGDVMRFERALLQGRVVGPGLLRRMTRTRPSYGPGEGYGLGLMRTRTFLLTQRPKTSCGPAWGHTGSIPGYHTFAYSSRDARHQFVVAYNEQLSSERAVVAMRRLLEAAFCGRSGR